jgi:lipopolysaccharide transport system ATP-binding protein
MAEEVVCVDNLSKRYRIGTQGAYKDLRSTVTRLACAPFNYLSKRLIAVGGGDQKSPSDDFIWALSDVSFCVNQGEVVGLIGRNGSGKSTLLKLLSRITAPTEGRIRIRGRIGNLLEVGTGFHPELTGRENIYLNGSILGMTRKQIAAQFDEIVQFSEIERFIDTPVKYYSSGMYMRLGFAVAAHLDTDILLVDEVLAVGDLAFQRKCLSKMSESSACGKTVIFVSHNMQAISRLTRRCLVLLDGKCVFDGATNLAIEAYYGMVLGNEAGKSEYCASNGPARNRVAWAKVHTSSAGGRHVWGEPIVFEFLLDIVEPSASLTFSFQVMDNEQRAMCHFWLFDDQPYRTEAGRFRLTCEIPKFRLYMGTYTVTTHLASRRDRQRFESPSGICQFTVTMEGIHRDQYDFQPRDGVYIEDCIWRQVSEECIDSAL